jgi:hypothetical protein
VGLAPWSLDALYFDLVNFCPMLQGLSAFVILMPSVLYGVLPDIGKKTVIV